MVKRTSIYSILIIAFILGIALFSTIFEPGLTGYITYGPGGCIVPEKDISITTSGILCSGTYYLNTTEGNAIINIDSNDVILQCNNTELIGNNDAKAISIVNKDNIEIKNCIISNYEFGIISSDCNNCNFENNSLTTNSYGIYSDYPEYSTFTNNTFNENSKGMQFYYSNNDEGHNNIEDNNFYKNDIHIIANGFNQTIQYNAFINGTSSYSLDFNELYSSNVYENVIENSSLQIRINSSQNNIYNNSFIKNNENYPGALQIKEGAIGNTISDNIFQENSQDITIANSPFSDTTISTNSFLDNTAWRNIEITNTNNVSISNNYFDLGSQGILVTDRSYDIQIIGNTLSNYITNYDGWNTPIILQYEDIHNIYIKNNIFENFTSAGILVRTAYNITIENNTFNEMSMSNKILENINDENEIPCAISILQLFKKYYADGTDVYDGSQAIQYSDQYSSDNITIINNNFGTNTQCKIYAQGTSNLNQNLIDYWYVRAQFPTYLLNTTELYLSNNFDTLTYAIAESEEEEFWQGHGNFLKVDIKYKISKTNKTFKNNKNDIEQNISLFNLSLAHPYNDVYNKTGDEVIASNVNEINLTLGPSEEIIIGNYTDTLPPEESNDPPSEPATLLSTASLIDLANQHLNCSATISDPDNDVLNATVTWFKNNSEYTSNNFNNNYPSNTDFEAILNSANTNNNEEWLCQITITDGNSSISKNSSTLTITPRDGIFYSNFGNNDSNSLINSTVRWYVDISSEVTLDKYIFEFDNTNQTNSLAGTSETISINKELNETGTYCAKFYMNNTNNDLNQTSNSCTTVTDPSIPPYLNYYNLTNNANSPEVGDSVTWQVIIEAPAGIDSYLFTTNESGTYEYDSYGETNETILTNSKTMSQEGYVCGRYILTDKANNTNGTSYSCFEVSAAAITPSSGGGSGGGSGGAPPPTTETNETNITIIEPKRVDISISNENKLSVTLKNNANERNIKTKTVENIDLPPPTTHIYKYIEITHDNINDKDIEDVKQEFSVKKEWLTNNLIEKEDVRLYRYNDKWEELETKIIKETENTIEYEAKSKGLSIFAIGANKKEVTVQTQTPKQLEETKEEVKKGLSFSFFAIIIALLSLLFVAKTLIPKEPKTNELQEDVCKYMDEALTAGYTKHAINHALRKKGFHENMILYCSRKRNVKHPVIRYKRPINTIPDQDVLNQDIIQLIDYIQAQKKEGFRYEDIKHALLHFGHSKIAVERAMQLVKKHR